MTRIAVLLTTFNRREKTVTCLKSLKAQELPADIEIKVYLTDDASKDGTADAVKEVYPGIQVYHGTGSFFWAGGMRHSWRQALAGDYDYYLLLNDDTTLSRNAINTLLNYYNSAETAANPAIIVGSTVDETSGDISYGGRKLISKNTIKNKKVHSDTEYAPCDLGNANIMLVPHSIVKKIGILSDAFTHGIADYDYTLKAKRADFAVLVAPGILGSCVDDHGKSWKSTQVSLKERIKYLKSPKGLAYKEYLGFIEDHFPLYYPSVFCKLWMKTLFPFIWDRYKKTN